MLLIENKCNTTVPFFTHPRGISLMMSANRKRQQKLWFSHFVIHNKLLSKQRRSTHIKWLKGKKSKNVILFHKWIFLSPKVFTPSTEAILLKLDFRSLYCSILSRLSRKLTELYFTVGPLLHNSMTAESEVGSSILHCVSLTGAGVPPSSAVLRLLQG